MATIKGIKNRLSAAGRALGGDYALGDGDQKPAELLDKENRKAAAKRALNGDYALRDGNKPVVRLDPVEIKLDKVYQTKEEAEAAAEEERPLGKAVNQ